MIKLIPKNKIPINVDYNNSDHDGTVRLHLPSIVQELVDFKAPI